MAFRRGDTDRAAGLAKRRGCKKKTTVRISSKTRFVGTKTARTDESSGRELTLDLFIARVQESGSLENRKRPADKSGVKHALHIVFVNLWEGARWGERRGWGAQTEREENGVHARGHRGGMSCPGAGDSLGRVAPKFGQGGQYAHCIHQASKGKRRDAKCDSRRTRQTIICQGPGPG